MSGGPVSGILLSKNQPLKHQRVQRDLMLVNFLKCTFAIL